MTNYEESYNRMKHRVDPRLKTIPLQFWDELLDKFLQLEKARMEAES